MATEVAPEGGDAPRTTTDGAGEDRAGFSSAGGSEGGAPAGAGQGAWDDVVLDADFVRDAETAEPSARARMLAARWRQEAPDPQPWRSDEPPAGWFFSKARRRRWRRR
ncbi:hypothetical protein [Streptomyces scabiei]|uniref:SGM_3592 family protein n=1 Tax=Streptomyces scabiei TaxID=1930 RepID=UPI001B327727|nr:MULTISPECIES: hypothetical protein [Streptomyces]MBP5892520.1 hypothetical protein [Streptomyces sp. LBUM 1481]MBP5922755.1 hypothetical protein [Streptomyces sp. LBUM 1483]MDX2687095.1 hypothetical protein [Streptomyces scabiei]MDX2752140.1 hypothetical protein [Streptomyces scabiei]MDX2806239.1 hypothetical protein [Streptomyces scabiei]